MDRNFAHLGPADSELLDEILIRRNPLLVARIGQAPSIARENADEVVTTLSEELTNNLDTNWEPTEYGEQVSGLLARVNAARIAMFPAGCSVDIPASQVPDPRNISPEEVSVIKAVVGTSTLPDYDALLSDIENAVVTHEAPWVLDVQTSNVPKTSGLPDGPFPVRAYVPSQAEYRGEVIVWLKDGRISGLEYAWITDEAPTRWPEPHELEIVPNSPRPL